MVGGEHGGEKYYFIMTNKTKGKRQKPSTDTESDDQASQKPSTSQARETLSKTSRFLVISSLKDNKSVCSLSPFVIFKTIKNIAGEPKSIKNLKSGDLLVECERESHIKNLLKTTTFFNIKCQDKLHNTLNSSKGIVRCPALKGCTNEHIVEEMMMSSGLTTHQPMRVICVKMVN